MLVWRQARGEALLIALALAHAGLLLSWPSFPLIAIGLWWNANTIAHNFIHRPFFRAAALNAAFSCYLSLLLGFPQSLWRARHLAHHGASNQNTRKYAPLDVGATVALWATLLTVVPRFALTVYLPGYLCGLALCSLQGHYEHARGTVSHYGWLYNFLFLNDGYHREHHAQPGLPWRELPNTRLRAANASRYPAVLRWLEGVNLCTLERWVLRSASLQRFVLEQHERALCRLLAACSLDARVKRVGIVGGGLFPRTALILRRLRPEWRLALIDLSAAHLDLARGFVADEVEYIHRRFDPAELCEFDLLIIPLSFVGDRRVIYQQPSAAVVLVHDWIWRPRGTSVIVSWLLLKRFNLVRRGER